MSGKACNGWKFWSIAEAASPKLKTSKTRAKQAKSDRQAPPITEPTAEGEGAQD